MEGKRKRVTFGAPEERAPQMARYCEDDDDGSCGNSPPPADDDAAAPSEHDMAAAATDEAALRRVAAQAKAQRSRAYLSNISENLGLADTDKDVVVVRRAVQEHAADGDEDEDAGACAWLCMCIFTCMLCFCSRARCVRRGSTSVAGTVRLVRLNL